MKRISKIFLAIAGVILLFLLFIVYGQFWTFKKYNYHFDKATYNWGAVYGSLYGTSHKISMGESYGSPYELHILVKLNKATKGLVICDNISMLDLSTNKMIYVKQDAIKAEIELLNDNVYGVAIIIPEEINMDFSDHRLTFDLKLQENGVVINQKVDFKFIRNYEEKKYNIIMATIMSA